MWQSFQGRIKGLHQCQPLPVGQFPYSIAVIHPPSYGSGQVFHPTPNPRFQRPTAGRTLLWKERTGLPPE